MSLKLRLEVPRKEEGMLGSDCICYGMIGLRWLCALYGGGTFEVAFPRSVVCRLFGNCGTMLLNGVNDIAQADM